MSVCVLCVHVYIYVCACARARARVCVLCVCVCVAAHKAHMSEIHAPLQPVREFLGVFLLNTAVVP